MNAEIEELLTRWRVKDEQLDRGTWHSVSKIAGAVSAPISGTRKALHALADAGRIERGEFNNGTYWRGPAAALSNALAEKMMEQAVKSMDGYRAEEVFKALLGVKRGY